MGSTNPGQSFPTRDPAGTSFPTRDPAGTSFPTRDPAGIVITPARSSPLSGPSRPSPLSRPSRPSPLSRPNKAERGADLLRRSLDIDVSPSGAPKNVMPHMKYSSLKKELIDYLEMLNGLGNV
jgi:hypothetical protein